MAACSGAPVRRTTTFAAQKRVTPIAERPGPENARVLTGGALLVYRSSSQLHPSNESEDRSHAPANRIAQGPQPLNSFTPLPLDGSKLTVTFAHTYKARLHRGQDL
jgi:hypothetical protein